MRIGDVSLQVRQQIQAQIAPQISDACGHTFWIVFFLTAALFGPALALPRHGRLRRAAGLVEATPTRSR
ncbi:hypothetical protein [Nonomuraea sp. SYSU D8015]|uniref:hypothetical protein n=1 Tax=Nonomuraea sp. SYSU D8015 TaxID=2593644 RepID=UPI0016610FA0|nr:hypothetical protein [Nonomuraea sp. SYSU D8015]